MTSSYSTRYARPVLLDVVGQRFMWPGSDLSEISSLFLLLDRRNSGTQYARPLGGPSAYGNQSSTMPRSKSKSPALRLAGMGAELAGAVLGFALIGFWIDRYYGTRPWGLVVCAILGLVGGLYNFIRSSLKTFAAEGSGSAADSEDSGEGKTRPR